MSAGHAGDVLLVDDHPPNLEVMSRVLTQGGYRIRAVTSGERALEAAKLLPPECILLDVAMPGMNGFETCRAVRQVPTLAQVPVIFLTASNELSQRLEGFASGGQDYVTKPFQAEEVLARVATQVRLFRAQRELATQNAELVAARARVEQTAAMRARLSAMLIHDLKSPLTVIRCALDSFDNESDIVRDADLAFQKVMGMVHELLELSRNEDERKRSAPRPVNLNHLVTAAASSAKHFAVERGIELRHDIGSIELNILGDAEKLDRVLSNLLENAIKYSGRGTQVSVTLGKEEGAGVEAGLQFGVISVRDTGPGIPARELPYIFDPYQQREPAREPGSVGLGLSIVQRLVADHGGRVRVRSRVGVGSEFQVLLPL